MKLFIALFVYAPMVMAVTDPPIPEFSDNIRMRVAQLQTWIREAREMRTRLDNFFVGTPILNVLDARPSDERAVPDKSRAISKVDAGLDKYKQALEETRRVADLTLSRRPGPAYLYWKDEVSKLEKKFSALERSRVTLQKIFAFMESELALSEGLTAGKAKYQGNIRQYMEGIQNNIKSSCDVIDQYRAFIENIKLQIEQMESDSSSSKCENFEYQLAED